MYHENSLMSECSSAVEQHGDVLGCLMQEQMLGVVEVLPLGRISEQIVDFPAPQIVEEFSVTSGRGGRYSVAAILWKKRRKRRIGGRHPLAGFSVVGPDTSTFLFQVSQRRQVPLLALLGFICLLLFVQRAGSAAC